jgi:hypothetical protein
MTTKIRSQGRVTPLGSLAPTDRKGAEDNAPPLAFTNHSKGDAAAC